MEDTRVAWLQQPCKFRGNENQLRSARSSGRSTGSWRCAGQQSRISTGLTWGNARTTRAMVLMMACINGASIHRDWSLSSVTLSGTTSFNSRCTRAGNK